MNFLCPILIHFFFFFSTFNSIHIIVVPFPMLDIAELFFQHTVRRVHNF